MSAPPNLPWIAINLDARKDRWELLQAAFPGQAIERFSALTDSDSEVACRKSHLAVVQLAKERGYPWVAVLEDDCTPYPEFQTELPRVLAYLWANRSDWDVYNGGPGHIGSVSRHAPKILRIGDWISAQFIIIQASAYDAILAHDPTRDLKKIDAYYSHTFRTLTSTPMLTRQLDMYSDLAKEYTNNQPLFDGTRRMLSMFG